MISRDGRLLAELGSIFDALVAGSGERTQGELEEAARNSLAAVTRWMIDREAAAVLAAIRKPVNQRNH